MGFFSSCHSKSCGSLGSNSSLVARALVVKVPSPWPFIVSVLSGCGLLSRSTPLHFNGVIIFDSSVVLLQERYSLSISLLSLPPDRLNVLSRGFMSSFILDKCLQVSPCSFNLLRKSDIFSISSTVSISKSIHIPLSWADVSTTGFTSALGDPCPSGLPAPLATTSFSDSLCPCRSFPWAILLSFL